MPYSNDLFIDKPDQLDAFVKDLRGTQWLAVDTEFMRGQTFLADLCLLQVATEDVVACIDAVKLEDLSPIEEVLFDPSVRKVMHSGYQDLEIFYERAGRVPGPLFDTQIASAALGFPHQIGFAALVHAITGVELDKAHTRTDWARRPLSPEQIRYAADDVRYLRPLYTQLTQRLLDEGREQWPVDDFFKLSDPETYANPPEKAWRRLRGGERLEGVQLAVLRALASWREVRAREWNRPRRWVVSDPALLDMARALPETLSQLEQTRDLDKGVIKKRGPELLAVVARAAAEPPDAWPAVDRRRADTQTKAQIEAMWKLLATRAEEKGVHPSMFGTRRDVERVAFGDEDVPLLTGWRRELVGEELLKLRGEMPNG